ncbi:unnamed protein product [Meganyctiphanes norvegica]|uniref:Uncharacterized protein n=1 Tax=Meganyctiphanes norvegica TaxID=48144 RepID=A0AAV2QQA8_MEGNR
MNFKMARQKYFRRKKLIYRLNLLKHSISNILTLLAIFPLSSRIHTESFSQIFSHSSINEFKQNTASKTSRTIPEVKQYNTQWTASEQAKPNYPRPQLNIPFDFIDSNHNKVFTASEQAKPNYPRPELNIPFDFIDSNHNKVFTASEQAKPNYPRPELNIPFDFIDSNHNKVFTASEQAKPNYPRPELNIPFDFIDSNHNKGIYSVRTSKTKLSKTRVKYSI